MDATLLPHSRFVECKDGVVHVNATNLHYRELNRVLRCLGNPEKTVHVINVLGQRYIGTDINSSMELHIYGTPGNDLAAFMDGGKIVVHGNSQDGVGNTMNSGVVIVQGRAGDIVGHSMRGGEI
jgi:glutamate synthase domain-containing protein 3